MRAPIRMAAPLSCLAVLSAVLSPAAVGAQDGPQSSTDGSGSVPTAAMTAAAQPPESPPLLPRLTWDSAWGRSGTGNYVLIGTSLAAVGVSLGIGTRQENPTRGGILWDEQARDTLRLGDEVGRQVARDLSDVFLTILVSYPTVVDAILVASWMHDSPDVGVQLGLMHAEVVTLLLAIHQATTVAVSRERPYGRTCGGTGPDDTPEDTHACEAPDRYASFFSGHASQSFAGAALTCINHMHLDLYGGSAVGPCITGFVMAGAVGLLRVMGDMHYSTDVITGAVMGTAVGFLVPYLLHYGHDEAPLTVTAGGEDGVSMTILPTPTGASIFGTF